MLVLLRMKDSRLGEKGKREREREREREKERKRERRGGTI